VSSPLQQSYGWPILVRDVHQIERPYLKHLAKLVLDEDASPQQFGIAPELFALYVGVTVKTWDTQVRERFVEVRLIWDEWLRIAVRIIQAHLRDGDYDEAD
jgi:hypothetical protein